MSEYLIATSSDALRSALWQRDRGVCAGCGKTCWHFGPGHDETDVRLDDPTSAKFWADIGLEVWGPFQWARMIDDGWEADHVVPLWSVDREARDAFRFWTIDNAQTLCLQCHRAKSAREAQQRAKERRIRERTRTPMGGKRRPKRRRPSIPF